MCISDGLGLSISGPDFAVICPRHTDAHSYGTTYHRQRNDDTDDDSIAFAEPHKRIARPLTFLGFGFGLKVCLRRPHG